MSKNTSEPMSVCALTLNPKQAIALRDLGVELKYRCPNPECGQSVIVVSKGKDKSGVTYKAHFQHLKRNSKCRYGVDDKPGASIT
jgi:hypothetical protein